MCRVGRGSFFLLTFSFAFIIVYKLIALHFPSFAVNKYLIAFLLRFFLHSGVNKILLILIYPLIVSHSFY